MPWLMAAETRSTVTAALPIITGMSTGTSRMRSPGRPRGAQHTTCDQARIGIIKKAGQAGARGPRQTGAPPPSGRGRGGGDGGGADAGHEDLVERGDAFVEPLRAVASRRCGEVGAFALVDRSPLVARAFPAQHARQRGRP